VLLVAAVSGCCLFFSVLLVAAVSGCCLFLALFSFVFLGGRGRRASVSMTANIQRRGVRAAR
jgi:hypothetical protein